MYIYILYLHLFFNLNLFQFFVATAAHRQSETDAETLSRYALDSQGLYMHDVFAHVSFYSNFIMFL